MKTILLFFILTGLTLSAGSQTFEEMAQASLDKMKPNYERLANANIELKVRERGSAMAASYTWWSVFRKPSKRKYRVLLNKDVKGNYICFEFDRLDTTSQNGVMAHELAHIDLFHSFNFFGFLRFIVGQALPNGLRKSERATDIRTIKNGMGIELRSWSQETRSKFKAISNEPLPMKFSNRYLTPYEIDSVMKLLPLLYPYPK